MFSDARDIPEPLLQPLAREINLSETVFVYPPANKGDARIRIFTPSTELPFLQGLAVVRATPGVVRSTPGPVQRVASASENAVYVAYPHPLCYVRTNWKEVGTPYVVLVLAWLAGELITSFAASAT